MDSVMDSPRNGKADVNAVVAIGALSYRSLTGRIPARDFGNR
jgi:hypothetical protein